MNNPFDKVHLQWFAEGDAESKGEDSEQKAAKKSDQSADASKQEGDAKSETVARAVYDKLLADLENFKRIEEERKGKEKARQEALLKEQGKYKDLYETATKELEATKARLEKSDAVFAAMLAEEMKDLPEDFDKSLIPVGDPHDQILWLHKAKAILIKKPEPKKGDGTPPAGAKSGLNDMASIYTHPTSPAR